VNVFLIWGCRHIEKPATGYWQLATSYWQLATGNWRLAAGPEASVILYVFKFSALNINILIIINGQFQKQILNMADLSWCF